MASKNLNIYTHFCLLPLLLLSVVVLNNLPHVRGRSLESYKKEGSTPTKGTVKTIEGDDGDVVDCVDVYNQPAFNHPLLKDHKIQKDPSSFPSNSNGSKPAPDLIQPWHRYGSCSEGTVPIRRRQLQDTNSTIIGPHREYASVLAYPTTEKWFYGGRGQLSLWEPVVSRPRDFSASTLTVSLTEEGAFLMVGWIVNPVRYDDTRSRFFIYWTTDSSESTGCYDLDCDGFVQVNEKYSIGSRLESVSTLGADHQLVLEFTIVLDRKSGNWWLLVGNEPVGYWPAALFSGIPEGARRVSWGGQVYDSVGSGQHTDTDMGNGLFPDIGTNKASFICSLQYVDSTFTLQRPPLSTLLLSVTNPLCYNAELFPELDPDDGQCFLFGGPGRNSRCP